MLTDNMATQRSKQPIKGWGEALHSAESMASMPLQSIPSVAVFGYICPAGLTRAAAANA